MCLVMKMSWFFQFIFLIKNLNSMDLLLLINDDKSHYVYIKDLTHLCFIKQKIKIKKWFCKSCCLQCFNRKMF